MAIATKGSQPASASPVRDRYSGLSRPGRRTWLSAAVLCAAFATVAAFVQRPRPDALQSPRLLTWSWWRYPVERHAFTRIPHATEEPHVVFALEDGQHVWAAGAGGLVLRSEDGGRTWSDTTLGIVPDALPAAAAWNDAVRSPRSVIQFVAQKQEVPEKGRPPVEQKAEQNRAEPPYQQTAPDTSAGSDQLESQGVDSALQQHEVYRILGTMCFADRNNGWVAGNDALFRTTTGGRQWVRQRLAPGVLISAIACADAQTAWLTGFRGEIYFTNDGGQNWQLKENTAANLFGAAAADARRGIVVGSSTTYTTSDAGQRWRRIDTSSADMRDVAYLTPARAVAVGRGLVNLIDTGVDRASWAVIGGDSIQFDYHRIAALGDRSAMLATRDLLRRTTDGFSSFTTDSSFVNPGTGGAIWDLAFSSGSRGWLASGGIHRTDDAGDRWYVQLTAGLFHHIAFRDSLHGVVVGEQGLILTTSDGGESWQPRRSGTTRRLVRVWYASPDTVAAVTGAGNTLVSLNGGRTWITTPPQLAGLFQPIPPSAADSAFTRADSAAHRFRGMARVSNTVAFGLDEDGVLKRTTDAGRTWIPITPTHQRWPAPWYYLALVLSTTMVAAPLRRNRAPVLQQSIADVLVSDRPWRPQSGDRDALGFRDLATGIAQFLANRRTNPPLTIAIIGAWGTGKTSLMNMLHHNLRRRKFYPIWFNAWHHQKEDSLLAALFEGIRQQGIPPIWAARGLRFRMNLLWLRLRRYAVVAALVIAVLALGLGYFLADPVARMEGVRDLFTTPLAQGEGWWDRLVSALGVFVPALGLVVTYLKGWRPFGKRATELVVQLRTLGGVSSSAANAGTRYAFAKDFKEVADALKPHPMVIFVDDLDRCQPQQVMEVLEAINFLQTCGDVVIVMGMDRERVIGCVGFAYKDVAADLVTNLSADTNRDGILQPEEVRADFARQYLEKLVNIEVPVPVASADGLGRVMTNRLEPDLRPDLEHEDPAWVQRTRKLSAGVAALAMIGLLVYAGLRVAPGTARSVTVQPAATSTVTPANNTDPGSAGQDPVELANPSESLRPAVVHTSSAGSVPLIMLLLPVVLIAAVLARALRTRPETIVDDSDAFREAMELWTPLLFTKLSTPRSAKKFMNRVRFLAMLQRAPAPRQSALQSLRQWSFRHGFIRLAALLKDFAPNSTSADTNVPARTIPEDVLVSLCAVRECQPEWMDDAMLWEDFGLFMNKHRTELPGPITHNLARFRSWGSLSGYRDRFFALTQSVRIH